MLMFRGLHSQACRVGVFWATRQLVLTDYFERLDWIEHRKQWVFGQHRLRRYEGATIGIYNPHSGGLFRVERVGA